MARRARKRKGRGISGITPAEVTRYIENHIKSFHDARLQSLRGLKLKKILARKNPYLYRAKNITIASEMVHRLLEAHLSSQEEAIFGTFLEGLARFVCGEVYGGHKSSGEGIDLELDKDGIRYIIAVKSGPNWGNSGQIKRMKDDFVRAKRVLRTSAGLTNVAAVNGCCYGKANKDCGEYYRWCGQKFWTFISGNPSLYTGIIEPLGHKAKERNEEFLTQYSEVTNRFTGQFIKDFCTADGRIQWQKIVRLNSAERT